MKERERELVIHSADDLLRLSSRRSFLRVLGIGGSVVLMPGVFAACSDDDTDLTGPIVDPTVTAVTLDLSNDTGILNLTYALEQVESSFYNTAVGSAGFANMTAEQKEVIADIRAVENIHRFFLANVLGSARIGTLALNQTALNTAAATPASILRTAEMLEDTGVAAINGAGKYLQSAANLTLAGKMVSVEARHVAAIRDIREAMGITGGLTAGTRFAGDDIVVPTGEFAGLDTKLEAPAVLARVASTGFLTSTVTIGTPPATRSGTPDFAPPTPTP
jgi:hypothetical protein